MGKKILPCKKTKCQKIKEYKKMCEKESKRGIQCSPYFKKEAERLEILGY